MTKLEGLNFTQTSFAALFYLKYYTHDVTAYLHCQWICSICVTLKVVGMVSSSKDRNNQTPHDQLEEFTCHVFTRMLGGVTVSVVVSLVCPALLFLFVCCFYWFRRFARVYLRIHHRSMLQYCSCCVNHTTNFQRQK